MIYRPGSPWPWSVFDITAREKKIIELEKELTWPDFWSDQRRAQDIMRQLAEEKRAVKTNKTGIASSTPRMTGCALFSQVLKPGRAC